MVDITIGAAGTIQPAEVKDVELYHPKSWVTKYVFCQDAKVIAIQYSITAICDWIGGSGVVVADTAAIGFPEHLLRHRPRRLSTSSSPCTA